MMLWSGVQTDTGCQGNEEEVERRVLCSGVRGMRAYTGQENDEAGEMRVVSCRAVMMFVSRQKLLREQGSGWIA